LCVPQCRAELIARQAFARKVVSTLAGQTADIEREERVIKLLRNRGHGNIVSILHEGWSQACYFIDMELCDFSLYDYLAYHKHQAPYLINLQRMYSLSDGFAYAGCSDEMRLRNMWVIVLHIAQGLEFLHGHGYVHRDIKPNNSMFPIAQVHS